MRYFCNDMQCFCRCVWWFLSLYEVIFTLYAVLSLSSLYKVLLLLYAANLHYEVMIPWGLGKSF